VGRSPAHPSLPDVTTIETCSRPDAPYDLGDEAAAEWWAVVNRLPADWFPRETHALLGQYCRHVVAARRIAQLITAIEKARKLDIGEYDRLLRMQERESRIVAYMAEPARHVLGIAESRIVLGLGDLPFEQHATEYVTVPWILRLFRVGKSELADAPVDGDVHDASLHAVPSSRRLAVGLAIMTVAGKRGRPRFRLRFAAFDLALVG
jgi:hypothetical protein